MTFTMMRIRKTWIGFLMLLVLIRGEFSINLGGSNYIPNMILIRVQGEYNQTERGCSTIRVSDIFPETTIAISSEGQGSIEYSPFLVEPVLVTIYNPELDRVCESQRKHLAVKEPTNEPTVRIFDACYKCNTFHTKEAFRIGNSTLLSRTERVTFIRSYDESAIALEDVSMHSIQHGPHKLGNPNFEVEISIHSHAALVSEQKGYPIIEPSSSERKKRELRGNQRFSTAKKLGEKTAARIPVFQSNLTEMDSDATSDNSTLVSSMSLSSIGVQANTSSDESGALPTASKPSEVGCSPMLDECCSDSDCSTNDNICVSRTCIDQGSPRFTLSWWGNDDYDLYVATPSGFVLSFQNEIDEETGGRVGEPMGQDFPGYHVENVYFPVDGSAPSGMYQFYVRPLTTVGVVDQWTLAVVDESGEVARHTGTKFSPVFEYIRSGTSTSKPLPSPTRAPTSAPIPSPTVMPTFSTEPTIGPTDSPEASPVVTVEDARLPYSQSFASTCDLFVDECCADSDCLFAGEVCFNRNCIDDGNPRITLSWVGDDDLDLFVVTPAGAELSFMNFFDPVSGGRFGEEVDQFGTGYHVENVYFPMTGAPYGIYQFFARPLTTVNERDIWTLTVVDNGSTMISETGSGASPRYTYLRERPEHTPAPVSSPSPVPDGPGPVPTRSPFAVPTGPPQEMPGGSPTRPPQTDMGCNPFFDECCENSDCRTSRDVCEQRTCLRDGNPRFTLIWDGDDDLDLILFTPDGIEISQENTFDIFSGGRFEMDSNQNESGMHVESVYFPLLGTPAGIYRYEVRSTNTIEPSVSWILEISEAGELVSSTTGTGSSGELQYSKDETIDGPQRPTPSPPRCSPISDECCLDSDCEDDDSICVQRTCIDDGSPRITLRWTGDDDLNLIVETPSGVVLSKASQMDPISGGIYQESPEQNEYGFHVESVYFPADRSEAGSYKYTVESAEIRGVGADVWTVNVYEEGEEVAEESGIGNSREFDYERLEGAPPPAPPAPSPPPFGFGSCSTETDECCEDQDCDSGHICANRHCVHEGNPRVTLTWVGDDDLDLYLRTPHGDIIYFDNQFDTKTRGTFDTESKQTTYGFHTENIYFPMTGSPLGGYTAAVRATTARTTPDVWTVQFYEGGMPQKVESGTGDSEFFTYNRRGNVIPTAPTSPGVPPASPPAIAPVTERPPPGQSPGPDRDCPHECCSDNDCGGSGEICVQRTCIRDGTPRFTLTWTGNDDLSLVVVTPGGKTISYLNPSDGESGGAFAQDENQSEFGFHVENIFFPPSGGPDGEYKYFVKSTTTQGDSDRWALRVFVEGELVAWRTGTGESRTYTYGYGAIVIMPTVTPGTPPVSVPPVATRPPVSAPTTQVCQIDSQCSGPGEICVQETCINDGNPRFTLIWSGNDDLDFFIETPDGAVISRVNPFDPQSGGIFGEPGDQYGFDRHVENIYFPLGPSGTYSYYVRSTGPQGSDDFWRANVSVEGESQVVRTGSGDSVKFTFDFDNSGLSPIVPTPPPVAMPPGSFPTQAPSSGGFCDTNTNECCSDLQCIATEICTQRTCIDEGTPRFTLTWTGNDDLDLVVQTPLGTFVSFLQDFDETSGGRFGDGGDQFEFGQHVESVFFPAEGGPLGNYNYYVRSFLPVDEADVWTVNVFVDGQTAATTTGTGDSGTLTYDYTGPIPTLSPVLAPTRPPTQPPQNQPTTSTPECSPLQDECCSDSDCITGVETCVQNQCIDLGNPRFTLTWTGDDDLDLKVQTPLGTEISFVLPLDEVSGGVYGEGGSQLFFDAHVESIYFKEGPSGGAPIGLYTYSVESFFERSGNDRWTVAVYVDNQEVASETGFGDSIEFIYDFQGAGTGPSTPPLPSCDPDTEECCVDSECTVGRELCVQQTCIDRGNPRFTLTWTGDDDLDLTVVTPFGSTLAVASPVDPLSGGVFGEEGDQLVLGRHVENVYFPLDDGGPSGTYTFLVSSFIEVGTADEWSVSVFVDDEPVMTQVGTGTSDFFVFEYNDGFAVPLAGMAAARSSSNASNNPATIGCNAEQEECCSDVDCAGSATLCAQRICIDEGNPRFTLTWNGNDDYDLLVKPPIGTEVSCERPIDYESGGRFGEGSVQAHSGLHAENIFFPREGGPLGTYSIHVQSSQIVDDQDTWTVGVFIDGEQMESFSGFGDSSESLTFEYNRGGILSTTELANITHEERPSCEPGLDQCCTDKECPGEMDRCLQRSCIPIRTDSSSTMIVLTWIGDDDLDLIVVTPSGEEISYYKQEDVDSGAFFEQSDSETFANERLLQNYQSHSERVTIPSQSNSSSVATAIEGENAVGSYQYKVSSFNVIGSDDEWTCRVFVNGTEVSQQKGRGDSENYFSFEVVGGTSAPSSSSSTTTLASGPSSSSSTTTLASGPSLRAAEHPTAIFESGMTMSSQKKIQNCTATSDCLSSTNAVCLMDRCLQGGSLQFTLVWNRDDEDLVLSIWAPDNDSSATSSYYQSKNAGSGSPSRIISIVGWESVDEEGLHIRNLALSSSPSDNSSSSLPSAAVPGKYKFSITTNRGGTAAAAAAVATTSSTDGASSLASWQLWIHENGREVFQQNGGSSGSSFFGYEYYNNAS